MNKKQQTHDAPFSLRELPEFDDHEVVMSFFDPATALKGFIAIHNTQCGPAVGGTRFHYYPTEKEALQDALHLSRAMTYKCALAGVPYGGGKAVLMAPRSHEQARRLKSPAFWRSYARRVELLQGSFFTGEDVGLTGRDITLLAQYSKHIIGRPSVGGLPAHWAALSVFQSIRAALSFVYGESSLRGRVIAIKGLGNAGRDLATMLVRAGARVIGAEINAARRRAVAQDLPEVSWVSPDKVLQQKVDVLSLCALGGDLTLSSIPTLNAKIVCGAANNQCATPEDGERLYKRGIVYVPDYIANGGGLINVVDELHKGGYRRTRVEHTIDAIYTTVIDLLKQAKKRRQSPYRFADALAEKRFKKRRS